MRLPVALGLGILLLGAPTGVAAQSYGTYSGTGGSYPYTSYTPTGYSPYSGFASYPGGYASGMLPSGYSTNPYASAYNASAAVSGYNSIPYTYVSNTYNPYSPWAAAGSTTYPWATESGSGSNTASVYNAGAYPGYGTGQGSTASSTGYAAAYP